MTKLTNSINGQSLFLYLEILPSRCQTGSNGILLYHPVNELIWLLSCLSTLNLTSAYLFSAADYSYLYLTSIFLLFCRSNNVVSYNFIAGYANVVSPPLLYLLFSLFAHRSLFSVSIAAMTAKNSNTNFNTKAKGKPVCICSICEDPVAQQDKKRGIAGEEAIKCENPSCWWMHRLCAGISKSAFHALSSSRTPSSAHTVAMTFRPKRLLL